MNRPEFRPALVRDLQNGNCWITTRLGDRAAPWFRISQGGFVIPPRAEPMQPPDPGPFEGARIRR